MSNIIMMDNTIVMKVGGTSMGQPGHLENIMVMAQKAVLEKEAGNNPILVVSAQKGITDLHIAEAGIIAPKKAAANNLGDEFAALVSLGESKSAALMALAIEELGYRSRSFRAWQGHNGKNGGSGPHLIVTDDKYTEANITEINAGILHAYMAEGGIPVVAGFQGYSPRLRRITILKRDQSDYTAARIAVAVGASRCDFYTDVDRICAEDPGVNPNAEQYAHVSPAMMRELVKPVKTGQVANGLYAKNASTIVQHEAVEALLDAKIMGQSLSAGADVPIGSKLPGTTFGKGDTRVYKLLSNDASVPQQNGDSGKGHDARVLSVDAEPQPGSSIVA